MKRRQFIVLLAAGVAAPVAAFAGAVEDTIVAQLTQQGFTQISISRTLLGRSRILATSATYRREIIVNPRTGEILRDYWEALDGATSAQNSQILNPNSGSNSGKGSSSSGSGSSGSGSGSSGGDDHGDDDDDDHGDDDSDDDEPEDKSGKDH